MAFTCALSFSGGLDSSVLCAALLEQYGPGTVYPVFFRYGSKHNPLEEKAVRAVAAHYALEPLLIDLSPVFCLVKSALLAGDERPIPKGGYDAAGMAVTVVPGRNLVFASVLASLAESRGIRRIALAVHAGDHHVYPDCRPAFAAALAGVIRESTDGGVSVLTPFSSLDKAGIVREGLRLGVPFALTRSCYETGPLACGRCGTCRERLDAFARNGVVDPAPYAS